MWWKMIGIWAYIGDLGCRVDEARSGSMRVSAAQIVHFAPHLTKNKL